MHSRDYRRAAAVGELVIVFESGAYCKMAVVRELVIVFEEGGYCKTVAVADSIVVVVLWALVAARRTTVVDDSKVVG